MGEYNQNREPSAPQKCEDLEPTPRIICLEKRRYCNSLILSLGNLSGSEAKQEGDKIVYDKRKCNFIYIEKNYHFVRNLELNVGVELIQATTEIKNNVTSYVKQNDDLAKALKELTALVKDAKTKFVELQDTASKLKRSSKDKCNDTQMTALGCKTEDCSPDHDRNTKPSGDCEGVCDTLKELFTIPDSLSEDIGTILNSSAEVVGIQSFSNIKSLEKFQADLFTNAKAFDDLVLAKAAIGSEDMKTAQKALTEAAKQLTISNYDTFRKRTDVEKFAKTQHFLCKPDCDRICNCGCNDGNGDENKDRLKKCKCEICDICKEVQDCTPKDDCGKKPINTNC